MKTKTSKKRKRLCRQALLKKIRIHPDPILKTKCDPYENPFDAAKDIKFMALVLNASKTGVGISANQVGIPKRLIGVRPMGFNQYYMINPIITYHSPETDTRTEACLSYPNLWKKVERSLVITVHYTDINGRDYEKEFGGWEARIIQHEIDHLDGKCPLGKLK